MPSQGVLVFPRASAALLRAHVSADAKVVASDVSAGTSSQQRGDDVRVVAVDGGADACLAAGIVPALIVGDMDSVATATLTALVARGARLERHPTSKRDTDAALALAHMRDRDDVLFLGAGGGRADHALANLQLMAEVARWARVRGVDDDAQTWIATPQRALELRLPRGTVLSALPLDPIVEGISYEGLDYPLSDATMRVGDPYGMSNVAAADIQRIRVTQGRLLVMRPLV